LHTKYERPGPCGFREKDFQKFFFYFPSSLPRQPEFCIDWNNLNNFERGPPKDHFCQVWSESVERFRRLFEEIVYARTDARTHARTDNGKNVITKAHVVTM
ncbi:MAG: hypothetical protein N0C90_26540, partial [Candidatus Thiodiazotropha endolucinida]|nr:hypothetical protein [Candidatus Thiodiazotropha taylori]MCW4264904.1 hypothetical protein [Candidatus Thiodiazotropha endolucinida]